MAKRPSFGYKMRMRLSDITNSQSQSLLVQEENLPKICMGTEQHLNQLMKENMALVKLLKEKDKIIEVSTIELQNLRVDIHKLQVQNWSLAQSNSQFLAEINLARNKMKALQHEIMCKSALLKSKNSELEGRANEKSLKPEDINKKGEVVLRNPTVAEILDKNVNEEDAKPSEPNSRRIRRSKSMGASSAHRTEADKAKAETKRRRMRRQSAGFSSQDHNDGENLFELEDIQLTVTRITNQDSSKVSPHKPNIVSKEDEEEEEAEPKDSNSQRRDVLTRQENIMVHRSSLGRPLRRAVEKIHSYKEVPLNSKMRRSEQ